MMMMMMTMMMMAMMLRMMMKIMRMMIKYHCDDFLRGSSELERALHRTFASLAFLQGLNDPDTHDRDDDCDDDCDDYDGEVNDEVNDDCVSQPYNLKQILAACFFARKTLWHL